jgi:hypothetical protein
MKKIMPKPKLLPLRVSIAIECKPGIKIENAHVKPYDNCNDLFKVIEDFQTARGDPVLSWAKHSIRILLTGPLYDPALKTVTAKGGADVEMIDGDGHTSSESLTQ